MQYRVNPRNGERISALGLGCMRFPGALGRPDQRQARDIISRAVERGINYLDTAYLYPGNEACVGVVLEELGVRDRVLVATKLPHGSVRAAPDLDRILDEQLRRLRTDHVDYYLIHNVTSPGQWDRLRELGIEGWVARQRDAGRIRQVGGRFLIEFQIPRDDHVRPRRNRTKPLRIRVGLNRNQIEHPQQRPEKETDFAVSPHRVIRHAPVHQRDRDSAAARLGHKVRPDLRLEDHQHRRLQDLQRLPNHPEKIDRAEDHRRIFRRLIAHEFLTRRRRRRQNELPLRMRRPP